MRDFEKRGQAECKCDVCVRYRAFRVALAQVPVEHRQHFESLYTSLCETEEQRDYYRAIVKGTWPDGDRILAAYRQQGENGVSNDAERIVELEREIGALKRGEFICSRCGVRKDAEGSHGDHGF